MSKYNCFLVAILLAFVCHRVDSQVFSQTISRACEGNTLYLACPSGSWLSVAYANYGRVVWGCQACQKIGYDWNILCFSSNATVTLRDRCNDRENCSVPATNAVFGNPCPFPVTYKYLEATYSCIPYQRVCEGSTLNITCPAGQKIYIQTANYGRTMNGNQVCQYSDPSATTNTNCRSANSTTVVGTACNGKNTCAVRATNAQFGGDPCPGTYKYLQASYYCT